MEATAFAACIHTDSSACHAQRVPLEKACISCSFVGVLRSSRVRHMPFLPCTNITVEPCLGVPSILLHKAVPLHGCFF